MVSLVFALEQYVCNCRSVVRVRAVPVQGVIVQCSGLVPCPDSHVTVSCFTWHTLFCMYNHACGIVHTTYVWHCAEPKRPKSEVPSKSSSKPHKPSVSHHKPSDGHHKPPDGRHKPPDGHHKHTAGKHAHNDVRKAHKHSSPEGVKKPQATRPVKAKRVSSGNDLWPLAPVHLLVVCVCVRMYIHAMSTTYVCIYILGSEV